MRRGVLALMMLVALRVWQWRVQLPAPERPMPWKADLSLDAMLKRRQKGVFPNGGGFQSGFLDRMGAGAEVFDWSGKPCGYEGHLVYCWAFLHSMLRKEPVLFQRVLPPVN